MTPLIITFALLAIAAVGVWGLIRRNQAKKLAEQKAREESERLAAESRLALEKSTAEAKALDEVRPQAKATERNRMEAEAKEPRDNARAAAEEEARRLPDVRVEKEEPPNESDVEASPPQKLPEANQPPRSPPTENAKPDGAGHIPAERRGGGQMETKEDVQPTERRKRIRSGPQLRLVSFKGNDRMWRVAVELPEDFSAAGDIVVSQNGQPLESVRFGENRWTLKTLTGSVEARNGGQRWQLDLGDSGCWLFKLLEEGEAEEGRLVSAATRGDYLLIMPDNWTKSVSTGVELRREYNIGLAGYAGCRWNIFQGVHPRLEFLKPDGGRVAIPFRAACFALEGESASAVFGKNEAPLFPCSPPRVRALDSNAWLDVEKVVVRRAGQGHGNLEACFPPTPVNNEVELSEHLKKSKGGWYDVRLYDANGLLMDSLYFAFARPLRGVRISGASLLPTATGHGEARIEFEHDGEASVEAFFADQKLQMQPVTDGVAYAVPSRCEQVDWQISWPGCSPMKCTSRLERIWWALATESLPPIAADWTDKRLTAKRQDFRASSPRALWILLPWQGYISDVRAGFEHSSSRKHPVARNKREVMIPLREFCDTPEVVSLGCPTMSIWLRSSGETAVVIETSITGQCKFCDTAVSSEQDAVAHFAEHWERFMIEDATECRPYAAYKCESCGKVVYARHSTDFAEISRHATRHSVTAIFTPIDLPVSGKCKCGFEVKGLNEEQFIAHLRGSHALGELFNFV
jgi:hypothetical protein